jgi:transposase
VIEPLNILCEENEQLKALLAVRTSERDGVTAERDRLQAAIENLCKEHEAVVIRLTTEILALKRQLFGPKAERVKNAEAQQSLFDVLKDIGRLQGGDVSAGERAESMLGEPRDESERGTSDDADSKPLPPRSKKQKKRTPHGRRKLNEANLPVEHIVIEPLERKLEGGDELVRIGEEKSSHLDYRPSSIVRVEVVRPKYMRPEDVGTPCTSPKAMPAGPETDEVDSLAADTSAQTDDAANPVALVKVLVAEQPELPISKGLAGPGLLALVLVMKYADHLPLFRQERIFKRQGVYLPRSTLCGFVQGCYFLLKPLVEAMWKDAKLGLLLLTDACGVLVRDRERCRRGHFQVFIAPGRHVIFSYLPQNNGAAVADLLKGFRGKLLSDASSVYHETYRRQPAIIESNCWAHARRGLFNAYASAPELALVGIGFIGQLYDAHDASVDPATGLVDAARRKALAEPVLRDLATWLESERPKLVPSSPIEVAMGYIQRQWTGLTRFLDDGSLRLDNNPSELELRHQKVGAKNWLFCATDGGAKWNAVVVSLIASCRMHDIEPHAYLRDVLSLLASWKMDRILDLAPVNWRQTLQKPETQQELKRRQLIGYDVGHAALHTALTSP